MNWQNVRISSIPNGILLNLENGTIQEKLNENSIFYLIHLNRVLSKTIKKIKESLLT